MKLQYHVFPIEGRQTCNRTLRRATGSM
jgi:hypothetical protein